MIQLTDEHKIYMNFGRRYWRASLDKATDQQKDLIRPYVVHLRKNLRRGIGLYLYGPNGSGKTYLASALLQEIWVRWSISGYCITASELKDALIHQLPAHDGSEETTEERINSCGLLVIDDVGKEHRTASGYFETQIGSLLRYRSRRLFPTMVTTNLSPDEFLSVYGLSVVKLLKECMIPLKMTTPDMREKISVIIRKGFSDDD